MIVNGRALLNAAPIRDMVINKVSFMGTSYGLGEAGYDLRLKQDIRFDPEHRYAYGDEEPRPKVAIAHNESDNDHLVWVPGRFILASAMEEFQMPENLVGIVHDKSTWARRGLSVFNTVIEPGFKGGLTLELVFHGMEALHIPAGAGIAQVLFHQTQECARYNGKYQHQSTDPEPARESLP